MPKKSTQHYSKSIRKLLYSNEVEVFGGDGIVKSNFEQHNSEQFKGPEEYVIWELKNKHLKKWGVVSLDLDSWDEKIIIPFKYDKIEAFSDNWIKAFKNNYWGILDKNDSIIFPFEYDEIEPFANGKIKARKGYREWGILDESANIIVPFEYDEIEPFINGKIKARKGYGKWGILDENANVIIPYEYNEIEPFTDGKIKVSKGHSSWGILDESANIIVPLEYGKIEPLADGKIKVCKGNGKWGILDENANIIVPCEYNEIEPLADGKIKVCKGNGKWGILNTQGETIAPLEYAVIGDLVDGKIKVRKGQNDNWGFLNIQGEELIVSETELFNGMFKGEKMGKWGMYTKDGKTIIPFEYEEIEEIHRNMIKVRRQGYWGVLDLNGNEVIPCKYSEMGDLKEERIKVCDTWGKWGYINFKGKAIIPLKYNQIGDFEDGIVKAYKDNCWGCLDEHDETLISSEMLLSNGLFKGEKWGKWGVYSDEEHVLIPFEYDYIDDFENGKIFVTKNGIPGYLDENGEVLSMSPYKLSNGYVRKEKLGKYGVCAPDGNIVIPFEYDGIEDFVNGRIKVCKKSEQHEQTLWGILNDKGEVIIPCEYDQLGSFENGKIIAAKLGQEEEMRWGCLDYEGNVILPFWYYKLENIQGNKVKAYYRNNAFEQYHDIPDDNGDYGLYTTNYYQLGDSDTGELHCSVKNFEEIYVGDKSGILVSSEEKLSNGYWKGERFGRWGVYTDDNKIILPFEYDWIDELDGEIETGEREQQPYYITERKYWNMLYPGKDDELIPFIFNPSQEHSDKQMEHTDDDISHHISIENKNIFPISLSNGFVKSVRNKKWGIYSENGNVIIPFKYDNIEDFKNGMIKARKGHFCGYYDEQGNILIPFEYYSLGELVEGKIKACKRGKWGAIDINNHIVVPFEFDGIDDFKNGEATVYWWDYQTRSMWRRTVNNKGELLTGREETLIDDLLKGTKLDKWGAYKTTGEIILPFIFDHIDYIQHIGIVAYFNFECMCSMTLSGELTKCTCMLRNGFYKVWNSGKWGVYSTNHEIVLPFVYDSLGDFYEGKISALKNGYWGVVDEHNRIVIPFLYDDIEDFHEGKIVACKNEKWGCLDSNAWEIIPFEYDYLRGFENGLCKFRKGDYVEWEEDNDAYYDYDDDSYSSPIFHSVPKKGKYGYLNENGIEVIPGRCSKIGNFSEGKIVAYHHASAVEPVASEDSHEAELPLEYRTDWVCFNSKGETLPFFEKKFKQYYEFGDFHEDKIKVQQYSRWGCADIEGKLMIPCIYENLGDFSEGKIAAKKQGELWGYLNEQGEVIIPFTYSEVRNFHFGIACAKVYDKWGAIDATDNVVIPFEYEEIGDFDGEKIKVLERINGVQIIKYIKLK